MDEGERRRIAEEQERVKRMAPQALFDYSAEKITAYMLRHPSQQEGEIVEELSRIAEEIGKWRHGDAEALSANELRRICLTAWRIEEE